MQGERRTASVTSASTATATARRTGLRQLGLLHQQQQVGTASTESTASTATAATSTLRAQKATTAKDEDSKEERKLRLHSTQFLNALIM